MSLKILKRILTATNLTGLFRRNRRLILDAKITRELSSESENSPSSAQTHIIRTQASSLIKQLSSIHSLDEERVIEIGCGDGLISVNMLLPSLEPVIDTYTAIDVEPLSIEDCRNVHEDHPISFFVADITEKESLKKHWLHYFTLALSLNVMSCLNEELALSNINRLLRWNGFYVFSWCSPEGFFNILRDVKDKCRIPDERLLVPESLPECSVLKNQQWELAKHTNFQVEQLEVSDASFSFEDENLVRDFLSSMEYFVALPPRTREEVFGTFYEEYRKRWGKTISLRNVSAILRRA